MKIEYYDIQVGDIIEEYNCTGSSDRATEKEYEIISVTKTLAKTTYKRFKRSAENWNNNGFSVKCIDDSKWSVRGYRIKGKQ